VGTESRLSNQIQIVAGGFLTTVRKNRTVEKDNDGSYSALIFLAFYDVGGLLSNGLLINLASQSVMAVSFPGLP
jgi:hypothetical protein